MHAKYFFKYVSHVSISNSIFHFSLKLIMNNVILEEPPRKVRRLKGIQTDILLVSGNSLKNWKCHLSLLAKPWNYNTKRNNVRKFFKSLWNSKYLWSWVRLAINKNKKYFSLSDHQLAENVILIFDFYERAKKR